MEDNRSRLLTCALDLFAARGYDAVGVQEVAEAAGVKLDHDGLPSRPDHATEEIAVDAQHRLRRAVDGRLPAGVRELLAEAAQGYGAFIGRPVRLAG